MEQKQNNAIRKSDKNTDLSKKNTFRKTISVTIILFAIGLVFAFSLFMIIFVKYPYIYYAEYGKVTIIRYIGKEEKITIPEYIRNMPVTSIKAEVFLNHEELVSVTLPSTLQSIGDRDPFMSLQEMRENIGDGVFAGCKNLTSIIIPEGVTYIRRDTFTNCTNLKSVSIPSTVIRIEENAFYNCTSLNQVTLPDDLEFLERGSFANCIDLKKIVIPSKVGTIYSQAFLGCINLTDLTISEGVEKIGDLAFSGCEKLERVAIPDSVLCIYTLAFSNCVNLTYISIPRNVQEISDSAFEGCDKLTIYCSEGTYAEQYAIEREIPYIIIVE